MIWSYQRLQPAPPTILKATLALSLAVVVGMGLCLTPPSATAQMPDYVYYYNQGNAYFNQGELTKAIEAYERALPLASSQSVPIAHNNLATIYLKRGNYMMDKLRNHEAALSDFRRAIYLLQYGWPEGQEYSARQLDNKKIAQNYLKIGYTNLRINSADGTYHLNQGKALRAKGAFQEAVVEFGHVLETEPENTEALKAIGSVFNVLNRPDKSVKYWGQAVKVLGDKADDELLVYYGGALNKAGRVEESVQFLNQAVTVNPKNLNALKQLEQIWSREIQFNPRSALAHANLASVFQKRGMYNEALKAYTNAEALAQQDKTLPFEKQLLIRINAGTLYQEMRRYDIAERAYKTVLATNPAQYREIHTLANQYLATLYKETNRPDLAAGLYSSVLSADPNNATAQAELLASIKKNPDPQQLAAGLKAYGNRFSGNALIQSKVGEELHAMKLYDDAALFYRRAIQLDPNMAAAYANLGAVLQVQGKASEALTYFKKAAALDPQNETVNTLIKNAESAAGQDDFAKAVALQQQGTHAEAVNYFERALQFPKMDTAELRAAYGVSLQNLNRFAQAVTQYEKALAKDPTNGVYQYYLGTAHHQNNNINAAAAAYQKALQAPGVDPNTQQLATDALSGIRQEAATDALNQAVAAYEKQAYPQALNLVDKALSQDPANPTAHYYRGMILGEQNKLPQSIASYREALKYDPGFKDAYFSLGVALEKANDKPGAKNAYQKFLELAGDQQDDFTEYAQAQLKTL